MMMAAEAENNKPQPSSSNPAFRARGGPCSQYPQTMPGAVAASFGLVAERLTLPAPLTATRLVLCHSALRIFAPAVARSGRAPPVLSIV